MAIYADDKLIKRKQSKRIISLRVLMLVFAVIISAVLIDISATADGAYIKLAGSSFISIILIAVAWYLGKIMHVEYKYYIEDGTLHIDRSFMHYTSKEVFQLSYKDMKLVCIEKSEYDSDNKKIKTIDMSSKEKLPLKTVIYFEGPTCGNGRLVFEPNDELKHSLELFLRDKVHL